MPGESVGLRGACGQRPACSSGLSLEFCFTTSMGWDFVTHRVTVAPSCSNEQVEVSVTILTHLFVYFWLRWLFVAVRGLCLQGPPSGSRDFPCADPGPRVCGLSSCGARAWLLHGIGGPPRPGRFLTTGPQEGPRWPFA